MSQLILGNIRQVVILMIRKLFAYLKKNRNLITDAGELTVKKAQKGFLLSLSFSHLIAPNTSGYGLRFN
jgi:hypothetical protein